NMYTAAINRANPSCLLFLIDQSNSMADPWGAEGGRSKAQGLADIINRLLHNIIIRGTKEEGARYYFDVGVIGYGAEVGPAFSGSLARRPLVSLPELADNQARLEMRKK